LRWHPQVLLQNRGCNALLLGYVPAAGVPDDVFLHNVTEHVDYRGNEYDLTGQVGAAVPYLPKHHPACGGPTI